MSKLLWPTKLGVNLQANFDIIVGKIHCRFEKILACRGNVDLADRNGFWYLLSEVFALFRKMIPDSSR